MTNIVFRGGLIWPHLWMAQLVSFDSTYHYSTWYCIKHLWEVQDGHVIVDLFISIWYCCVVINYVSYEYPILNPCLSMACILCFSKGPNICLHNTCSMTLQHIHVSDTDLQLYAKFSFPFLKIGPMFALSQSSCNVTVYNDWLNMAVVIEASSVAVSLWIWAGRSSWPDTLFILCFCNSFLTPLVFVLGLSFVRYFSSSIEEESFLYLVYLVWRLISNDHLTFQPCSYCLF